MQKLLQKKLTPQQEAIQHDQEMDRRSGVEPGNTKGQKEIIEKRKKEQELRDANAKNSHLEKFIKFNEDPLAYLHSLVAQGDFADRGKTELFSLMTQIRIAEGLKELVSVLKARK